MRNIFYLLHFPSKNLQIMLKNDNYFTNIKWSPAIFCFQMFFSWKGRNYLALANVAHQPNRNTFFLYKLDFSRKLPRPNLLKSMSSNQYDLCLLQQHPSSKLYCQSIVWKLEVLILHKKISLIDFTFFIKFSFALIFSFLHWFFSRNHIR